MKTSRLLKFLAGVAVLAAVMFFWLKNEYAEAPENFSETEQAGDAVEENGNQQAFGINQPARLEETKKAEDGDRQIPSETLIDVPFTSQAPYGIWDEYHEEACEEASLAMVIFYLQGKDFTKKSAEEEIQKLIKFQKENYGDYKDSNAEEIVKLAADSYGIKSLKVIYDFDRNRIKEDLAKGNPIIVPAAGRLLGNPYYTAPGPLYHNLVLIGYEEDQIVTNDSGTKRGRGYKYDINTLYGAIHDFPGSKESIEKGRKAMIIITK